MMKENFWKRGGRRFVLIFAVLLFCGGLAFLLSELLPKYAPPDETEPTESEVVYTPPEDGKFWIKDADATITLENGVLTAHFADKTVIFSDLDWYHITYPDLPDDCQYYRADALKNLALDASILEKDFIAKIDIWTDGVHFRWENPAGDGVAYGLFLQYYVAKEYRLYNVRTLLTEEQFQLIKQKSKSHVYGEDALSDRLLKTASLYSLGTKEDQSSIAITDNYKWPMMRYAGA